MSPFSRSGSFIFLADSQPVPPELPEQIAARLREDAAAAKLAARVLHWLPAAGYAQLGLLEGATFRLAHMRQLSRRSRLLAKTLLLPYRRRLANERQRQRQRDRVLDALRRPFRLPPCSLRMTLDIGWKVQIVSYYDIYYLGSMLG
jgi:hypothetical protein